MPRRYSSGGTLDSGAGFSRDWRREILGDDYSYEPEKTSPFGRGVQRVASGAFPGLVEPPHRYEDFPRGRIDPKTLDKEQYQRYLGMPRIQRNAALAGNPTEWMGWDPRIVRAILEAPDPSPEAQRMGMFQKADPYSPGADEFVRTGMFSDLGGKSSLQYDPSDYTPDSWTSATDETGNVIEREKLRFKPSTGQNITVNANIIKDKKDTARYRSSVGEMGRILEDLSNLETGEGGWRGEWGSWLGNVFGNITPEWGQTVQDLVTGGEIPREKLLDLQKRLHIYGISTIELLTGEGSSRVSGFEQKTALSKSGAVGRHNDLVSQIQAVRTIARLHIVHDEIMRRELGKKPLLPVDTPEGIAKSYRRLLGWHFPLDVADEFINRLIDENQDQ